MPDKTIITTPVVANPIVTNGSCHSGIMWGAILAGALAMTIVMLLLLSLASAFGFASLSPWGNNTPAVAKTFAISGALVLIIIQWVSAGFGGYLAGRMRSAYVGAHTHEVFFRDTAHGFLTWALATLAGVMFLASAVMHGHEHGRTMVRDGNPTPNHYISRLFATPNHDAVLTDQDREEANYVLGLSAAGSAVSDEDRTSLIQTIATRTHLSDTEAEHRYDSVVAQEKNTVDSARKYAAVSSLFVFFSLMIGAFVASVAGGLGGTHRDLHYTTGRLEG